MSLNETIRQGRANLGWSTRQLAAAIKTSQPQVVRWESGLIEPSIESRVKLARVFQMPVLQLFPELTAEVNATMS